MADVLEFAFDVWWRVSMAAVVTMVVTGLTAKELRHGALPLIPLAVFGSVFMFILALSAAEAIICGTRSSQIRYYLRGMGLLAGDHLLPGNSSGRPRRWDFWLALSAAVMVAALCANGLYHMSQ